MPFKLASIHALVILSCLFTGCDGDENSQDPDSPQPPHFVECSESDAAHVLLLSVTVPGLFDGYQHRIPFCEANQGATTFGGSGSVISAGGGPDGGLNGLIGIESSTADSLSVRVDLQWTRNQVKGAVNELIDIPIAESGKKELSGGRTFEWQFAPPQPKSPD